MAMTIDTICQQSNYGSGVMFVLRVNVFVSL